MKKYRALAYKRSTSVQPKHYVEQMTLRKHRKEDIREDFSGIIALKLKSVKHLLPS